MNKIMIDNALNDIAPEFLEEYADSCAIEATARPGRVYRRIIPILAAALLIAFVAVFAVVSANAPPAPAEPADSSASQTKQPETSVGAAIPAENSDISLPAESAAVSQSAENSKASVPSENKEESQVDEHSADSVPRENGGQGGTLGALVVNDPRFKKAFVGAECVAHIKVLERLELDFGSGFTSFFKVELIEIFKGEFQDAAEDNTITIAQPGSEKALFGMPLFQSGEEYLLYLDPVENESMITYKMFGSNYSVVDVIHANEETYYCDRCGILSSTYTEDTGYDFVYNDEELVNMLIEAAGEGSAPEMWLRKRIEYGAKTFILTREELLRAFDKIQE